MSSHKISDKVVVIGCIEPVSFPNLGLNNVMAKIDTGAYTGALHCTNIKVVRRGKEKKRILKFTIPGANEQRHETENFYRNNVRSASGHLDKRYIISTEISIAGRTYKTLIGLADRRKMKLPVLIGRRFLRENSILVDVRINAEYDDDGESMKEVS